MAVKEGTKQIPLRLPEEMFNKANKLAEQDNRTFNNWVVTLIETAVRNTEVKGASENG